MKNKFLKIALTVLTIAVVGQIGMRLFAPQPEEAKATYTSFDCWVNWAAIGDPQHEDIVLKVRTRDIPQAGTIYDEVAMVWQFDDGEHSYYKAEFIPNASAEYWEVYATSLEYGFDVSLIYDGDEINFSSANSLDSDFIVEEL